jgi:hypothetical protein
LPVSKFEILIYDTLCILFASSFVVLEFGRVGLDKVIIKTGTRCWLILNEKLKYFIIV